MSGKMETDEHQIMGEISTIKMVVAPQFNYISMMMPVTISKGIIKQYNPSD